MADTLDKILAGCRKKRAASQKELYQRFGSAMYGLCLQYASNEEDARDVLQDGFVKVFQKLDQLKDPAAFPGWIRRIMINTALERYRSQVRSYPVDEFSENGAARVDNEAMDALACEDLVALIRELPPRYRMVFNLYAIEGYNHREISQELEISVGTSKSNLSRARAILQEGVWKLEAEKEVRFADKRIEE